MRTPLDIEQRLQRLESLIPRVPLRVPVQQSTRFRMTITGGQTVNGLQVVQYAADPFTPDKVYNPLTDTVYIVGLGYGTLYNGNGQSLGTKIVRHNFGAWTGSLLAGITYTVGPPLFLTLLTTSTVGGTFAAYPIIDG
jgi:hypothetical protein